MQRLPDRHRSPRSGRVPARWTFYEVLLIALSVALIIFPLYAEVYRWVYPAFAPAAPRVQEAPTDTPTDVPSEAPTDAPAEPQARVTETPEPSPTAGPSPTSSPTSVNTPTPTSTPTATPGDQTPVATNTPTPTSDAGVTITPIPTFSPTRTPTFTSTPGPSPTPVLGVPPLTLSKSASVQFASPGQEFTYSLVVDTNSSVPIQIEVRDPINAQLEVTGTSVSNGSCQVSGNTVVCNVTAVVNQPVSININVRVRTGIQSETLIANQAAAQDARGFTAASDSVSVRIPGGIIPPTPSPDPNRPTSPPATPTPPIAPSPTQPSTPPQPPAPPPSGGDGGGGGGTPPEGAPPPPPVIDLVLPPTPAPVAPAPQQPQQPRPTRSAGTGGARTATPTASPTTIAATDAIFFRMASNWGSAFPGDAVTYVIAVRNTHPSNSLRDLALRSVFPANLEITGLSSGPIDRNTPGAFTPGDPSRTDNRISLGVAELPAGQGFEVIVQTKIKPNVSGGTRIVAQAELTFAGLAIPLYSNIVTVEVVNAAQAQVLPTDTATATPTEAPTAMPTSTLTPVPATEPPTVVVEAGQPAAVAPTATPGAAGSVVGSAGTAPLPATSTGVPLAGFALLGATLLARTWRLHRAKSRI
ncbi:hypothetical protein [Roseiflexus castenholzii]|uniref:Conserved repeat domain n=1 Tax=Roseiflexus castenholzii (strain DSM 13941 / HLO8) TaxID=383372 RepID=A7NK00_ROSCS|nr:hypothetical protein [Roseiflexus castenholzii]ABU57820.1 conserved repeat domain [Roseiflexus castenholzii DSM 13941]